LFNPAGVNVDASTFGLSDEISGFVLSSYTMGESSFREGIQIESIIEVPFVADTTYHLKVSKSYDIANLHIVGFSKADTLDDAEIFGVTPTAPPDYGNTSTGDFPVTIIYGMAALAAVGGGAFFVFSNRTLKKQEGMSQQGIDPSRLTAYQTSAGAGGYQTNRAEAHLTDAGDYQQHRSVYDDAPSNNNTQNDNSASTSSTRGSMPKGWKPE
jgi:hypothetical protein